MLNHMNLSKEGWLECAGLNKNEIPDALILEGTWWHKERYKMRLAYLSNVRELKFPDMYLGDYKGKKILFCCAYGGPRAVEPIHAFGSMGTKCVIQIGSCGGLQEGVVTGDILLSERAKIGEGASQYYGKTDFSESTPELVNQAQAHFEKQGFKVHRGLHLTTSALFAQPPERVKTWQNAAYLGVDMETSAVFTAAAHFGMESASLLFVWDELLNDRTWLDTFSVDETKRQETANKAIFEVALELA